jgi:hypothetical protein
MLTFEHSHARATFNHQNQPMSNFQPSHIRAPIIPQNYPVPNIPYSHFCAPSITRHPYQLVQYLPLRTRQPPYINPNLQLFAQQNRSSLQQQPQQTRCVLQPTRLILREPQQQRVQNQQQEQQQQLGPQQQREPQIDPRRRFEHQNDQD